MFERIYRLYISNALTIEGVKNAVKKGLITEEQYKAITGEEFDG